MNNDVLLIPVVTVRPDLQTQTDVVVYTPKASKNNYGIVKIGNGLLFGDDGSVNFDQANIKINEVYKNGTKIEPVNKSVYLTIDKTDVGLSNVDNTSDIDKPVSNATKDMVKNNYISFTRPQMLTEEEQEIARNNIGAGTGDGTGTGSSVKLIWWED